MLAQFTRFMVALVAIGFAAFVADSLLRITEKAAEIVLPLDSLEQLADEPSQEGKEPETPPPSEDARNQTEVASREPMEEVAKEAGEKETVVKEAATKETPAKGTAAQQARVEPRESTQSQKAPVEAARDESRSAADVASSERASSDRASTTDSLDDEARVALAEVRSGEAPSAEARSAQPQLPAMFSLSEAGQLASFGGEGVGGSSGSGPLGQGSQPVWDVQVQGDVSARDIIFPPGFVLVGVRTRGSTTEIVPLGPTLPPAPLTNETFVKQFPRYASRQGIRLSSQTIRPWRERLLNYDSLLGWQAWLILDDATLADWLRTLRDEVRRQGRSLNDLAKVTSSIQLGRRGSRTSAAMTIEHLAWKAVEPTTTRISPVEPTPVK